MFGGLTHEPAIRLAQRLVEVTPDGLEHVFLADSGSVSVEVALKMALQYHRGTGRPERHRMLTVRGGYHGDTFGVHERVRPGRRHALDVQRRAAAAGVRRPAARPTPRASPAWAEAFERLAEEHAHELAGDHRRAAAAGRRRHARLPRRVPAGDARGRRPARPAAGLRRDRHRLRPHRHPLRRRSGRRHPRHHVRRQGADRPATSPRRPCCAPPRSRTASPGPSPASSCTGRRTWATRSPARSRWPTSSCSPPAPGGGRSPGSTPGWPGAWLPLAAAGVADVRTLGAVGVVQLDRPVDVDRGDRRRD